MCLFLCWGAGVLHFDQIIARPGAESLLKALILAAGLTIFFTAESIKEIMKREK